MSRLAHRHDHLRGLPPTPEQTASTVFGLRPPVAWALAAAALAALTVLRRPDALSNPQFYGEDGSLLFAQQLMQGFPWVLAHLFDSCPASWTPGASPACHFPYLLARLVALAVSRVPIAQLPLAYCVATIVLVSGTLATFVLPPFRALLRSDGLRVVFCVLVVGLGDYELPFVLINAGWYLTVWLVLLTFVPAPRSWNGVALVGSWLVLVGFSNSLCMLALPLWGWRVMGAWRTDARQDLALSLVATVSLLVLALGTGVTGAQALDAAASESVTTFSLSSLHAGALASGLVNCLGARVIGEAFLGRPLATALVLAHGLGVAYALAALGIVAIVALSWTRAVPRTRPLLCLYMIAGSILLMLAGRPVSRAFAAEAATIMTNIPDRYFVTPVAITLLLTLVAIERWLVLPGRRAAAWVIVVALLTAQGTGFGLDRFPDRHWPLWAARIDHKLRVADPVPLVVPINPLSWYIALDVRTRAGEVVADTWQPVDARYFAQPFVPECDTLSQVDIFLATTGDMSTSFATLRLTGETGEPIRVATLRGAQLAGSGWRAFYFAPLARARGRQLTWQLVVAGPAGTTTAAYAGSAHPAVPAATAGGKRLSGPLRFRTGCS